MKCSCFIFFQFIYMVEHIDRILYVEPSQNFWDKTELIIVDKFFHMFLDLICQYFYNDVHEGNCSVIVFLFSIFVWFEYQGNCSTILSLFFMVLSVLFISTLSLLPAIYSFQVCLLFMLELSGVMLICQHETSPNSLGRHLVL